jgi:hypothetical protein
VLISQNFAIGQFVIDSLPLPQDYFDHLDKLKEQEGDEDARMSNDDTEE